MRNFFLITFFFLAIGLGFIAGAYFVGFYGIHCVTAHIPSRPETVPTNAIWIGGIDGGVFIEISSTTDPKIYNATIYGDYDGSILYSGELKHNGETPFDPGDTSSYSGWDGHSLILRSNEQLIIVESN